MESPWFGHGAPSLYWKFAFAIPRLRLQINIFVLNMLGDALLYAHSNLLCAHSKNATEAALY